MKFEHEFQAAMDDKNNLRKVNAINTLLASALKGFIEMKELQLPVEEDVASLWNVVKANLKFDPHYEFDFIKSPLEGLVPGFDSTLDGLGRIGDLHFNGNVAGTGNLRRHRYLLVDLFAYSTQALIFVLFEMSARFPPF